jgi:sulfide:quinone oxidoreductase
MKNLVILGAGTAGTIMANKLTRTLDDGEWRITVVDQHATHYYLPGFLFVPFGIYERTDVVKSKRDYLPKGAEVEQAAIDRIEPDENRVLLRPEETEGLVGPGWRKNIFDFYTLEGAEALHDFLDGWKGGRMVVHITEMPIKCPVAPLEFVFLADWWFTERGIRDQVEITLVTPLPGAFTKPKAAKYLGEFLDRKRIHLVTEFDVERVDHEAQKIVAFDETEVEYDVLVTIPTNMGDEAIARSEMGDELNFVPTHPHTLQAEGHENIFVIGDATNAPSSKAGSVAHFQADVLEKNIERWIEGEPLRPDFDGHANCFIESGFGKGVLIDFNYDVEPLPGKFPVPGVGPFSLLEETKTNHWGKVLFRWMYWNLLLKGADLPIPTRMSMAGKVANEPAFSPGTD